VDVTLCDFAADVRAATPSHAAETVTPVRDDLAALVLQHHRRMRLAMERRVATQRDRLRRIRLLHPRQRVERGRLRLDELQERLAHAGPRVLQLRRRRLEQAARHLDALSPLAVLVRGYSIVTCDGDVVRDARTLTTGDAVHLRFAGGSAEAEITRVDP
jgi:exodeoxyribonuclease VII large subunit